jgi:hypothetical protein
MGKTVSNDTEGGQSSRSRDSACEYIDNVMD